MIKANIIKYQLKSLSVMRTLNKYLKSKKTKKN